MYNIEIDFDVFKQLTALRDTEATTYNDVIRQLVQLPPITLKSPNETNANNAMSETQNSRSWICDGVIFPNGTEFRAKYKGVINTAVVQEGKLLVNGNRFDNPSAAARSITKNSVNGWTFWECKMPGTDTWKTITYFRN